MGSNPLVGEAIDIMARAIISQLVDYPGISIDWEDYPEIGEYDWQEIQLRMKQIAIRPKDDVYQAALEFLVNRARDVTEV